ncbi:TetR/AcrR family transcriptional regulator [Erysipelothrix inopinata]|uniref:TetR/AcrR family transcriptional regulator n=1 Tax=Erysipelothrix inopinata TaxID=225084 RepID=A0A7G9S1D0_9FIRM|nr:TetR/AcrR family transcriptional regulator [Erysipelothrix inopinata]QNN61655.1 TetR/AcrR family transcriptional regulator [Erysipelothrix inopinata]
MKSTYQKRRSDDIIKMAYPVFSENGYANVTMKMIMEYTGLSRGGLYAHFGSVEDLFVSVLEYDDQRIIEELSAFDTSQSILSQFEQWILTIISNERMQHHSLTKAKSEFLTAHNNEYLQNREAYLEETLLNILKEALNRNEIDGNLDLKNYVSFMIASMNGVMLYTHLKPMSEKDFNRVSQFLIEALLKPLKGE